MEAYHERVDGPSRFRWLGHAGFSKGLKTVEFEWSATRSWSPKESSLIRYNYNAHCKTEKPVATKVIYDRRKPHSSAGQDDAEVPLQYQVLLVNIKYNR